MYFFKTIEFHLLMSMYKNTRPRKDRHPLEQECLPNEGTREMILGKLKLCECQASGIP